MKGSSSKTQLDEFTETYTPKLGDVARAALAKKHLRLLGANEVMYDNFSALAIGFSATRQRL